MYAIHSMPQVAQMPSVQQMPQLQPYYSTSQPFQQYQAPVQAYIQQPHAQGAQIVAPMNVPQTAPLVQPPAQQQAFGAISNYVGSAAPQTNQMTQNVHLHEDLANLNHLQNKVISNDSLPESLPNNDSSLNKSRNTEPNFELVYLRERHENVLDDLYWNQSYECKESGRRFKVESDLRSHIDDLFKTRSKNALFANAKSAHLRSRKWWPESSEWLAGIMPISFIQENSFFVKEEKEHNAEGENPAQLDTVAAREEMPSIAVDDADGDGHCALSGEKFDMFWHEEAEEWRYNDCVRLVDGRLVLSSLLHNNNMSPPTSPVRSEEDFKLSYDSEIKSAQDAVVAATTAADDGAIDLANLEAAAEPLNVNHVSKGTGKKRAASTEEEESDPKRVRKEEELVEETKNE